MVRWHDQTLIYSRHNAIHIGKQYLYFPHGISAFLITWDKGLSYPHVVRALLTKVVGAFPTTGSKSFSYYVW